MAALLVQGQDRLAEAEAQAVKEIRGTLSPVECSLRNGFTGYWGLFYDLDDKDELRHLAKVF